MAFLIGGANSAADTAFSVANSCRFNDGDSASMLKAAGAGDRRQYTLSAWVKRGVLGTEQQIWAFRETSSNVSGIFFNGDNKLEITDYQSGNVMRLITTAVYRDVGAWYHVCLAVDSEQGTAANRVKLYVNGVQVTVFDTADYPDEDADLYVNVDGENNYIGTEQSGRYFDGYMAEVVFIDGTQNAVTSFGEFNSDSPTIWQPIDVSGLTFGTNGFYLDFEASDNLGNDANGGTDFTESNLAAADQSTDTPTNNFCVMNPLDNYYAASVFSEGNTTLATASTPAAYNPSTFAVKKGKWYFEVKLIADSVGDAQEDVMIGISNQSPTASGTGGAIEAGDGFGIRGNGKMWAGSTETTGWANIDVGDVVIIAVDFDNGKFYKGIDGTWGNSGDPTSGATGTGAYSFTVGSEDWFMGVNRRTDGATSTFGVNFGGSSGFAISSAQADDNGYGTFEYDVPAGYYALCTKNLAEFG